MKPIQKMISVNKSLNNVSATSLLRTLTACLFLAVFALPMAANAQSSACAANETPQSYTFAAPNNWTAGAATIGYTIGTGAASVTVGGSATLNDIAPADANSAGGYPTTAQSGGFASAYYYLIDRTAVAGTNTVTLTLSKPISKLQLVATDIDTNNDVNGRYQDQVTIVGNGPTGPVTPTAVATSALVTIAGNVATAAGTSAQNCAATSIHMAMVQLRLVTPQIKRLI
jgi:hypothetical protein